MRDENEESKNKLVEIVKSIIGKGQKPQEKPAVAEEERPVLVPNYRNPSAPMSYEELRAFMIPASVVKQDKRKVVFLERLFRNMDLFLRESRRYSYEPADAYKQIPVNLPVELKIQKIQEQMRAIRFRLDVRDYNHAAERVLLNNRLFELYAEAKAVDPEGTARYERMLDKKMRRAR